MSLNDKLKVASVFLSGNGFMLLIFSCVCFITQSGVCLSLICSLKMGHLEEFYCGIDCRSLKWIHSVIVRPYLN